MSPERKVVAYHEAGHAVMAALSPYHSPGETVIRLEERELGMSSGSSSYRNLAHVRSAAIWDWRIAAGGGAGEKILNPKVDAWGYGPGFASPTAGRLDLITCGVDPYDMLDDDDPEVAQRREQRALREVTKMVRDRADAVHAIAAVLLERGRITGEEVRALVGPQLTLAEESKSKPKPVDPRQADLFGEVAK